MLIVEDDGALGAAMRETLRDDGYDADVATDGAAALEAVGNQAPDLIFVDLQLPLVDGPSFVDQYRRTITTASNIVVVSGRADALEIAQSIGADLYLTKPFERDDLLTAAEWSLSSTSAPAPQHEDRAGLAQTRDGQVTGPPGSSA